MIELDYISYDFLKNVIENVNTQNLKTELKKIYSDGQIIKYLQYLGADEITYAYYPLVSKIKKNTNIGLCGHGID